ncbi:uncharacterized protein TRIADDRAFT_57953 [Trichoplax adhaerens]|uniref:Uncharacterized protein n=1 Tax=Trichoplax adhaerens TaxID=10228 RepID=B3S276_TRIAD|nr:predicted protein [Trichoplax adhaerens]EDV23066.1 predicted protein [Trichoplax adhaerens]|eukprot:XP_002113976.1 predicted protein [Trichoplax adhaerens]
MGGGKNRTFYRIPKNLRKTRDSLLDLITIAKGAACCEALPAQSQNGTVSAADITPFCDVIFLYEVTGWSCNYEVAEKNLDRETYKQTPSYATNAKIHAKVLLQNSVVTTVQREKNLLSKKNRITLSKSEKKLPNLSSVSVAWINNMSQANRIKRGLHARTCSESSKTTAKRIKKGCY